VIVSCGTIIDKMGADGSSGETLDAVCLFSGHSVQLLVERLVVAEHGIRIRLRTDGLTKSPRTFGRRTARLGSILLGGLERHLRIRNANLAGLAGVELVDRVPLSSQN
jgi:hypothetical protein